MSVAAIPSDAKVVVVAEKPEPEKADDVVLIHGRSDDGALKIIRKKGEELSAGELRPMEEGKPIEGDVLKLRPRKETPLVCDVEEEVKIPRTTTSASKKPAKVASEQYRAGWEKLWGRRARARSKPN